MFEFFVFFHSGCSIITNVFLYINVLKGGNDISDEDEDVKDDEEEEEKKEVTLPAKFGPWKQAN
jgi:hypothetical protein